MPCSPSTLHVPSRRMYYRDCNSHVSLPHSTVYLLGAGTASYPGPRVPPLAPGPPQWVPSDCAGIQRKKKAQIPDGAEEGLTGKVGSEQYFVGRH